MELGYIKELTIGFIYAIMDEDKAMKKKQHIQKTNSFIEIIYTIPVSYTHLTLPTTPYV